MKTNCISDISVAGLVFLNILASVAGLLESTLLLYGKTFSSQAGQILWMVAHLFHELIWKQGDCLLFILMVVRWGLVFVF